MKTSIKFALTFISTLFLVSGLIIHANGQAIVLITQFVPCANNGAGEIVQGKLTANSISPPGRDSTSPYILRVSGVLFGSDSGISYQTSTIYLDLNMNSLRPDGANTATTVEHLKIEGGGTVFTMATVFHITYTGGDGNDLLVEIEHDIEKCLTRRFRN